MVRRHRAPVLGREVEHPAHRHEARGHPGQRTRRPPRLRARVDILQVQGDVHRVPGGRREVRATRGQPRRERPTLDRAAVPEPRVGRGRRRRAPRVSVPPRRRRRVRRLRRQEPRGRRRLRHPGEKRRVGGRWRASRGRGRGREGRGDAGQGRDGEAGATDGRGAARGTSGAVQVEREGTPRGSGRTCPEVRDDAVVLR